MALFMKQVFPRFSSPVRPAVAPLVVTPLISWTLLGSLGGEARFRRKSSGLPFLDTPLVADKPPAIDNPEFEGSKRKEFDCFSAGSLDFTEVVMLFNTSTRIS
uniref:Uncharacterized protein n=1 Tax=Opuntia streptacantha TaxID=393608 RepID=A0A7C9A5V1_OPUST